MTIFVSLPLEYLTISYVLCYQILMGCAAGAVLVFFSVCLLAYRYRSKLCASKQTETSQAPVELDEVISKPARAVVVFESKKLDTEANSRRNGGVKTAVIGSDF